MAMGRSVTIVKREVATHTAASMRRTSINRSTSCQFVMLKTLDRISADITGSGMNRKRGAIRSRDTTRKTATSSPSVQPAFSPDGSAIAFVDSSQFPARLFRYDLASETRSVIRRASTKENDYLLLEWK